MKKKSFVSKSSIGKLKLNKMVVSDFETKMMKGGGARTSTCPSWNDNNTCEGVTTCGNCGSWICVGGG